MADNLNRNVIMKALDYGYDKAVNGLPGMETAEEMAQNYMKGVGKLESQAKDLVRWQIAKASTAGIITGLGGLSIIAAFSRLGPCHYQFRRKIPGGGI